MLRVLSGFLFVLALGAAQGAVAQEAAKLTSRPLNPASNQSLTVLDEKAALERSQAALGKLINDYALLNRDGQPVRLADYRGKPLLVSFMYTGCFQVCPTTTKNLQKAIESLVNRLGPDKFTVISIGFNQPFDTPQAMKTFALQNGIRLPNWEFLSPAPAVVGELTQTFGFSYVQTAAGFDHLNQVTLVDAGGRIVRQVYGETFTAESFAEPLRAMLDGKELPYRSSALAELTDRIRILCSVYDPNSGRYRLSYGVVFEIAGAVTFILWLIWLWWSERRNKSPARLDSGQS